MKKLICILSVLLLLAGVYAQAFAGETERVPVFRAKMSKDAKMRAEPDVSSKYLGTVPRKAVIDIYEWGEDWSLCGYKGKTGYLMSNRIYEIWRLGEEPLPGMVYTTGVATIIMAEHVEQKDKSSGDLFSGITLQPGDMIAAISADGQIPFRRFVMTLPEDCYSFTSFVAVADAQPGDIIYAFTTYYNDRVGGNLAAQRRHNIELCVERLTGTILMPGEQFSFNEICGPYTVKNGYVKAPNISQSGYGVGGGVCQVSTTIFEAALGLNLELDQWEVHQVSGVKYAPLNFDAAVGSRKDLRFTNTLSYPVRLEVLTQNGALTAFFYRANEE